MQTILGYDVGGSKINVVEGNAQGQILRYETLSNLNKGFPYIYEKMVELGRHYINTSNNNEIVAVSVSIGGPLNINEGIILSPPNLSTWKNIHLKEQLSQSLGLPVYIEHDGNAGALAEHKFGAGEGADNLVFLTMGTGLGAGIILNGKIYHGSTDTAGEVGHIRISEDGPLAYGKAGSWEGVASGVGFVELLHKRFPGEYPEDISPRDLIGLGLEGDPQVMEVVTELGEWLGRGIAIIVDILNPEIVIIGTLGYIFGDLILDPAKKTMKEEALHVPANICQIVPAKLRDSLGNVSSLMAAISEHRFQDDDTRSRLKLDLLEERETTRQTTMGELSRIIDQTGLELINTLRNGKKIIVFGNGGSATQAQHLVGELLGRYRKERKPLPALALSADGGVVTCIGNDYKFEDIYSRQLEALVEEGDLVIGLTTSGKSKNVLKGLRKGAEKKAKTIALTGKAGLLQGNVDYEIKIASKTTAIIQEEHLLIIHYWCEIIDEAFD